MAAFLSNLRNVVIASFVLAIIAIIVLVATGAVALDSHGSLEHGALRLTKGFCPAQSRHGRRQATKHRIGLS